MGSFVYRIWIKIEVRIVIYYFFYSLLVRMLFNVNDDFLLKSNFDDNLKIEFEWYCFIIFMVLVNGAEGIGIGWSIKFSNYDVREIIVNIKRMLDGEDFFLMVMFKKKKILFYWYGNLFGKINL